MLWSAKGSTRRGHSVASITRVGVVAMAATSSSWLAELEDTKIHINSSNDYSLSPPSSTGPCSSTTQGFNGSQEFSTPSSSTSPKSPSPGQKQRSRKGQPYIPSYMDLTNGPEPCVVCGDAATGYHYRCMTCEGCKGFFRRTIQKNLKYHCKWNNKCVIDKTTRNQCQQCRYLKCINVGMATDLVLNERQRVAKRKLIEENRERRKQVQIQEAYIHHQHHQQIQPHQTQMPCTHEGLTEMDRQLISDIMYAYEQTAAKQEMPYVPEQQVPQGVINSTVWQQLAEVMTPSIVKVVEFAKRVPGFIDLNVDDQILLLKSCCMEIMCLRAACRYNILEDSLVLQSGLKLTRHQLGNNGLSVLVEPIFEFALGLAKLDLDHTEIGLLAAVLLMQSDRTGLKEPEAVERRQDAILGAYKRYIAERRPEQPVHWAKILMKVTDLRTISTRHAERVLCIKLDNPGELPPLFLEMFDEGDPTGSPKPLIERYYPDSPLGSNPSVVNSSASNSPLPTESSSSSLSSSPLNFPSTSLGESESSRPQTPPQSFRFPVKARLKVSNAGSSHASSTYTPTSNPVAFCPVQTSDASKVTNLAPFPMQQSLMPLPYTATQGPHIAVDKLPYAPVKQSAIVADMISSQHSSNNLPNKPAANNSSPLKKRKL